MAAEPTRYLAKSHFMLALECPSKLFYANKRQQYANTKLDNDFVTALAEGGFQVGALAWLMQPGGHEVGADASAGALIETDAKSEQHAVAQHAAAFAWDPILFAWEP
jgi:hypothetical protein